MKGIPIDPADRPCARGAGVSSSHPSVWTRVGGLPQRPGSQADPGGGQGWLTGKYGYIATSWPPKSLGQGEAVPASAEENPDLFWACGWWGNFGVVTSFEYRPPGGTNRARGAWLSTRGKRGEVLRFHASLSGRDE